MLSSILRRVPWALTLIGMGVAFPRFAEAMDPKRLDEVIRVIDERQSSQGDCQLDVHIEWKEKTRPDVILDGRVYRRDEQGGKVRKMLLHILRPKADQGRGYLRVDGNIWYYDASVGRWERRTERARIGGYNTRRSDLDAWELAERYTAKYLGHDTIASRSVDKIELTAKPGADVAFPLIHMWIDQELNPLKRQEYAQSGKLLRTTYYPRWKRVYSESKKADIWFPEETRMFDALAPGDSELIRLRNMDTRPLESSVFTKAWLEGRSR